MGRGAFAAPASQPAGATEPAPAADRNERNGFVTGVTNVALYGGLAQGFLIDRPRIAMNLPAARAQGAAGVTRWAGALAIGQATEGVIPLAGDIGRWKNGWAASYRASTIIGGVGLLAGLTYGGLNVAGALSKGGPEALIGTREGRTGVTGSVAGVFGGVVAALALAGSRGHGTTALGRTASHVYESLIAPVRAKNWVFATTMGLSMPSVVNEWGYLDFLDSDAKTGAATNARDTTLHLLHQLPVVGAGIDDPKAEAGS